MDPDRSSRVAARRIVEEVLADHAARATALDGVTPIVVPERPDTPAWRAARRIIEETLAEHAARAVVPATIKVEVVVDLDRQDVEVLLDLDGSPASPSAAHAGRAAAVDRTEPGVVAVVAPIERDETPAKAARRIVETVLTEQGLDLESPDADRGALRAFEIDPVPEMVDEAGSTASAEPGDAESSAGPTSDAEPEDGTRQGDTEPGDTRQGDTPTGPADMAPHDEEPAGTATGTAHGADADQTDAEPVALSVDEDALRAAIPEWLFSPAVDGDAADAAADAAADDAMGMSPNGFAAPDQPATGDGSKAPAIAESGTGPSTPVDLGPPDPDDPVVIASRIVADVLAEWERMAEEVGDAGSGGSDGESTGAGRTYVLDDTLFGEDGDGQRAPAPAEDRRWGGTDERRPAVDAPDDLLFDLEPVSPTSEVDIDGLQVPDPSGYDPRPDPVPPEAVPEELWAEEPAGVVVTDDEFGEWPDPIVAPRRTGRWLITTVMGAVLLAVLLPLAIGALRNLVSFS